jgi:hypothetical protein
MTMKTLLNTVILLTALVTVVSGAPSPIPTLTCTNFSKAFGSRESPCALWQSTASWHD